MNSTGDTADSSFDTEKANTIDDDENFQLI